MKSTAISIVIAGVLIAGAIVMMGNKSTTKNADTNTVANNVSIVDGNKM